jgi:hypothetical protein
MLKFGIDIWCTLLFWCKTTRALRSSSWPNTSGHHRNVNASGLRGKIILAYHSRLSSTIMSGPQQQPQPAEHRLSDDTDVIDLEDITLVLYHNLFLWECTCTPVHMTRSHTQPLHHAPTRTAMVVAVCARARLRPASPPYTLPLHVNPDFIPPVLLGPAACLAWLWYRCCIAYCSGLLLSRVAYHNIVNGRARACVSSSELRCATFALPSSALRRSAGTAVSGGSSEASTGGRSNPRKLPRKCCC